MLFPITIPAALIIRGFSIRGWETCIEFLFILDSLQDLPFQFHFRFIFKRVHDVSSPIAHATVGRIG